MNALKPLQPSGSFGLGGIVMRLVASVLVIAVFGVVMAPFP